MDNKTEDLILQTLQILLIYPESNTYEKKKNEVYAKINERRREISLSTGRGQ